MINIDQIQPPSPIGINHIFVAIFTSMFSKEIIFQKLSSYLELQIHKKNLINEIQSEGFYHMAFIFYVLSEINLNKFDFFVWLFSYLFVGALRNMLNIVEVQNQNFQGFCINPNKILKTNQKLQKLCLGLTLFSILYILLANICFKHSNIRINQILLYPTIMLLVDSLFYFITHRQNLKNILCNYNHNIKYVCPIEDYQFWYVFIRFFLKIWHFSYLFEMCVGINLSFATAMVEIICSLFAVYKCVEQFIQFRKSLKILNHLNQLLDQIYLNNQQICCICNQQLIICKNLNQCNHKLHFKCLLQWIKLKQIMICPYCNQEFTLNNSKLISM